MADNLLTLTMIIVMLSLLFGLVGATTTTNKALSLFGITAPSDSTVDTSTVFGFDTSPMKLGLIVLFSLAAGSVIISGLTGRSVSETVMLSASTVGILVAFLGVGNDFNAIMSYAFVQGILAGWIAILIMVPLYVAFLISLIKFWRGTD